MPDTDEVCTGMDVPDGTWGEDDIAFWTGTARYQPWKDVAAFFRQSCNLLTTPLSGVPQLAAAPRARSITT
jgi:hypothetical protein